MKYMLKLSKGKALVSEFYFYFSHFINYWTFFFNFPYFFAGKLNSTQPHVLLTTSYVAVFLKRVKQVVAFQLSHFHSSIFERMWYYFHTAPYIIIIEQSMI